MSHNVISNVILPNVIQGTEAVNIRPSAQSVMNNLAPKQPKLTSPIPD